MRRLQLTPAEVQEFVRMSNFLQDFEMPGLASNLQILDIFIDRLARLERDGSRDGGADVRKTAAMVFHTRAAIVGFLGAASAEERAEVESHLSAMGMLMANPRYQLGGHEQRAEVAVLWKNYFLRIGRFDFAAAAIASIPNSSIRESSFSEFVQSCREIAAETKHVSAVGRPALAALRAFVARYHVVPLTVVGS